MIVVFLLFEIILGFILFYIFYIAPKINPFNKGMKLLEEGNIDEAILEFTRAVEKDPENYIAHFKLAHLYLQKDVLLKAEEHFKQVLEIGKFNEEIKRLDILQHLSKIQFNLKKYEELLFTLKEILAVFPSDYTANYYLGLLYAGQLIYEEAIKYFQKAIRARPTDINTRINLALCYVQVENIDSAIKELEEAVKNAPENEKAKFFLAIALFMAKGYKKAIDFFLTVLKSTQEKERKFICYRLISAAFFLLDKIDRAKEFLDTGIEFVKMESMFEEYKTLLYDYGMMYASIGNFIQAKEKWKILNVIDENYPNLEELLKYIEIKTSPVEEPEEEIEPYLTPAAASYFKAAQHIINGESEQEEDEEKKYETIFNEIKEEWLNSFIPENFLWKLGGLTSAKRFNIEMLMEKEKLENVQAEASKFNIPSIIKEFMKLDRKKFEEVGRKIVQKLGYIIIKENFRPTLADFVEGDGIDFVAKEPGIAGQIVLIQLRRWDQGKVGEIPFRNMTQSMAEVKAKRGIFIVPAELTEGAQRFLEKMPNITVLTYKDMGKLLRRTL